MAKHYKINTGDITYRRVGNETILFNPNTGSYYSLNETGTFIWQLLRKGMSIEKLIDKFVQEFRVSKKIAIRDAELLLKDLISEKIIRQDKAD